MHFLLLIFVVDAVDVVVLVIAVIFAEVVVGVDVAVVESIVSLLLLLTV